MILPIVKVPQSVLTEKAKKVTSFDSKLKKLIADMGETLIAARDPEGVGLAAPQVGVALSLFVTRPTKKSKIRAYINPHIVEVHEKPSSNGAAAPVKKEKTTLEGCLSIDKIWAPLHRPQRVRMTYQTIDVKSHDTWFEGFEAVIMQHECDHLNGILFTKRAIEQNAQVYEEINGELEKIEV